MRRSWPKVRVNELSNGNARNNESQVFGLVSGQLLGQAVVANDVIIVENRDPTEADYLAKRIFYDGLDARRIVRTPASGHDRVVTFLETGFNIALLGVGIYIDQDAAEAAFPVETDRDGLRFYNRSLDRWELWQAQGFWDGRQFVAAPQSADGSLWIGEWDTEAEAIAHVVREEQVASYPDADGNYVLHRVSNIDTMTNSSFRYELGPLVRIHILTDDEIDNADSNIQGTVSGHTLARAVEEHSPFTDIQQDILDDLSRQTFPHPTDDWLIRQTYSTHDFFEDRSETFLSLGWDTNNRLRALSGTGHVARLGRHDAGRIYDGSARLRGGLISGAHWLFLRDNEIHGGSDIERAPVDGGDSALEFEINSIRYFGIFADPDSGTLIGILRRISATDMEVGLLAYDSVAATITAEDTITLTLAHINAALGADFQDLTDIHQESASGVYQGVSGALLEGESLYLLLTNIRKVDGHTASALIGFTLAGTPNNRTLTVFAENAVDELPVPDELTSAILPLEADELFIARDTAVYRLSLPSASGASGVEVDTTNLDGNLDNVDGNSQAMFEAIDDLALAGQGASNWNALPGRPDRPSAQEIIDGTSVEEATSSVSDVVAIANSHSQRTLANTDPEPVAVAATEGIDETVSRRDHVHPVPIDATLEFDPVSGDLGVNVHDVITHLQESIRYYTDSIDHPTDPGGHSAGQNVQDRAVPDDDFQSSVADRRTLWASFLRGADISCGQRP